MGKIKTTFDLVKEPAKKIAKKTKKYTTKRVQGMLDSRIGAGFLREGKQYKVPVPTKRFKKSVSGKVRDKFAQFKNVVLQKRKRKNPLEDIEPGYGQPSKRTRMHTSYENYKKTRRPDYEFESYNKGGIRKGKDFVKNMEKLKKIYGGKIPKSLTIEEADKALKKVTPIKKKNGGKVGRAITGDRSVQRRKKRTKQAIENLKKVTAYAKDAGYEGSLGIFKDLAKRAKPMSQFVSQPEAVKMLKKSGGQDRLTQKNLEELISIMKKKNGGTAKKNKKRKDPTTTRFKRVRDTILLAPEAVEIGKDILLNLPMNVGGMTKHSFPKRRNNGGVIEGIKKIKEGDKRNTMAQPKQGFDTRKAKKSGMVRGMTKRPLSDYKRMRKKVGKMLTGGQSKIDMNKNNKIDAEDFKILRARKMKNGGSITVKSKLVKNKPTKIL